MYTRAFFLAGISCFFFISGSAQGISSLVQTVAQQVDEAAGYPLANAADEEDLEKRYAEKMLALADEYDEIANALPEALPQEDPQTIHALTSRLQEVIEKLHQLSADKVRMQDELNRRAAGADEHVVLPAQLTRDNFVQPNDAIQGPRQLAPDLREAPVDLTDFRVQQFYSKLEKNELTWPDLIDDYIDPVVDSSTLTPLLVAHAAEVINNDINRYLATGIVSPEMKADLLAVLPVAQYRVLYRLNHLPKLHFNNDKQAAALISAYGTLRILLYNIHRLYKLLDVADPRQFVEHKWTTYTLYPTRSNYNRALAAGDNSVFGPRGNTELPSVYSYEQWRNNQLRVSNTDPGTPRRGWEKKELPQVQYQKLPASSLHADGSFLDAIQTLRHDEEHVKKGAASYQLLKLMVQYEVRYSLYRADRETLPRLVEWFEPKPSVRQTQKVIYDIVNTVATPTVDRISYAPTNLEVPYDDVLGEIFGTVANTLTGVPMNLGVFEDVLAFLIDMTAPTHSTNTRIGAIETASILNGGSPYDKAMAQLQAPQREPQETVQLPENRLEIHTTYPLDARSREIFGRRLVDIYAPLQLANQGTFSFDGSMAFYVIPTVKVEYKGVYGLDSQQMLALSDYLAQTYESFLPLQAPATVWSEQYNRYMADMKHIVALEHLNTGTYISNTGSGDVPTFVLNYKGHVVEMFFRNHLNRDVVREENETNFANLVLTAIQFYGMGKAFTWAYRGVQATRGALSAGPAAWQAFKTARDGRKWFAASVKIRQGVRYNGLGVSSQAARFGTGISTHRIEKVRVPMPSARNVAAERTLPGQVSSGELPTHMTQYQSVERPGTGYISGVSGETQTGVAGWNRRLWNWSTGQAPAVEKYTLTTRLPGTTQTFSVDVLPAATRMQTNARLLTKARQQFVQARAASLRRADPELARLSEKDFLAAIMQSRVQNPALWRGLSATERTLWNFENNVMATTGKALTADGSAGAHTTPYFDYWAYYNGQWRSVPYTRFKRLQNLMVETRRAEKPLVDYYRVLGVPRNASAQEIHSAYRKLSLRYHTDVAVGDAQLARARWDEISAAYNTLGSAELKAAYDTQLQAATHLMTPATEGGIGWWTDRISTARGQKWFKTLHQRFTSPEGYTLAVTPHTGITPANALFDPIAGVWKQNAWTTANGLSGGTLLPGLRGMGFNMANIGKNISNPLGLHLVREGQVSALGMLWVSNLPWVSAFARNLSFLAQWEALDMYTYYTIGKKLQPYLANQVMQKEMDKYGDLFKTPADDTKNSPVVRQRVSQVIQGARKDNYHGALITTPLLPLLLTQANDETKLLLSVSADKITFFRALAKGQQVRSEQNFQATRQQLTEELRKSKEVFEKLFAMRPADWGTVGGQVLGFYSQYLAKLDELAAGTEPVGEKFNKLDRLLKNSETVQVEVFEAFYLKQLEIRYNNLSQAFTQNGMLSSLQTLQRAYAAARQGIITTPLYDVSPQRDEEGHAALVRRAAKDILTDFQAREAEFIKAVKPLTDPLSAWIQGMEHRAAEPLVALPETVEQARETARYWLELTLQNWQEDANARGSEAVEAMAKLVVAWRADAEMALTQAATIEEVQTAADRIQQAWYQQIRIFARQYPPLDVPAETPAPSAEDVYDELLENADEAGSTVY